MKRIMLILTLITLLVLVSSVLTMESANYKLTWFTPLTGSGAEDVNSTNYAANFTIGQSVIGSSSSTNYESCFGYWCGNDGVENDYEVYLPLILKQ